MPSLDHYTESDLSDHDRAKRIIEDVLTTEARGKDNAISSRDLADRTPVSASTVRDLIQELRQAHKLPIGSSNGYFLIETDAEAERQIERQIEQARRSRQTAQNIAAAWNGRKLSAYEG